MKFSRAYILFLFLFGLSLNLDVVYAGYGDLAREQVGRDEESHADIVPWSFGSDYDSSCSDSEETESDCASDEDSDEDHDGNTQSDGDDEEEESFENNQQAKKLEDEDEIYGPDSGMNSKFKDLLERLAKDTEFEEEVAGAQDDSESPKMSKKEAIAIISKYLTMLRQKHVIKTWRAFVAGKKQAREEALQEKENKETVLRKFFMTREQRDLLKAARVLTRGKRCCGRPCCVGTTLGVGATTILGAFIYYIFANGFQMA